MRAAADNLIAWLMLMRPALGLAVLSQVWLMVLLAGSVEPAGRRGEAVMHWGVGGALGLSAVMTLGLVACAAALHDVLDRQRDRAWSRPRPIASGRVRADRAVVGALAGLVLSLAAAGVMGSLSAIAGALAGAGVVFYAAAGRYLPGAGLVVLGLIAAMLMAAANPGASLGWPLLLTMVHVVGCGTLWHRVSGRRPRLTAAQGWTIVAGVVFWSLVIVGLMGSRGGWRVVSGWGWVWPIAATAGFAGVSIALLWHGADGRAVRWFERLAAGWLVVYAGAWCLACGQWAGAALMAGLGVAMAGLGGVLTRLASGRDTAVRFQMLTHDEPASSAGLRHSERSANTMLTQRR